MRILKGLCYFILGTLSLVIGTGIFVWLVYNITAPTPEPHFTDASGYMSSQDPLIFKIFRVFSGFCMCGFMLIFGLVWIQKAWALFKSIR